MADGDWYGRPRTDRAYRQPRNGTALAGWQQQRNTTHRRISARVEHTLAAMKCWKILCDYRCAEPTLHHTAAGIARLHNLTITGY